MNDWMPIFLTLCMLSILTVLWRILAVLKKILNSESKIPKGEKPVKRRSWRIFKKRRSSKKKAGKDMENRLSISFHLPTDRRIMMNIGEISADVLRKIGIDELEIGDIQVALDEAFANIISPRLEQDPGRMVQLAIQCKADNIETLIYEAETPFHGAYRLKTSSESQAKNLGIHSAHRLMDKVQFEKDEDGIKTLRMIKGMGKLSEKRKPLINDEDLPDFNLGLDIDTSSPELDIELPAVSNAEPSVVSDTEMETFNLKSDEEFRKKPEEEDLTLELNLPDKKKHKSDSVPIPGSEKLENLNLADLKNLIGDTEKTSLSENEAAEEPEDFMLDLDFDLEPEDEKHVEPVVETGKNPTAFAPDLGSILKSEDEKSPPAPRVEPELDLEELALDPDFDLEIYDEEQYPEPEGETEEDSDHVTLELDPVWESEDENSDPEAVTLVLDPVWEPDVEKPDPEAARPVLDPVWESQDEAYLETEESPEILTPEPALVSNFDDKAEAGIEGEEEHPDDLSLSLAFDDDAYGGIEVEIEEGGADDGLVLEDDDEADESKKDSEDDEDVESFNLFDPEELLEIDKEPIAERKTGADDFVLDLALESESDSEKDIEALEAELNLETGIGQEGEKKTESLLPGLNSDMKSPGEVLKKPETDDEADATLNEMLAMLEGSETEESSEKD